MRAGMKIGLGFALIATAASAGYRDTLDDDGCWDARDQYGDSCITATSEWNGGRFTQILSNECPQRVYLKYCNERKNSSSHDCGAWGLQGYGEKRWTTAMNASGRYGWRAVGSTISNKDWVCSGKVRSWNNAMF